MWLAAGMVILSVVFLVFAPYAAARFLLRAHARDETETLSNSIIVRIASLHGLILALIFAQEQANMNDLRHTNAREAAAVADVFYDLDRYDPVGNARLRRAMAEYVRVVIDEEWEMLADGHLSQRAWDSWQLAYMGILDLTPVNPRQQTLRERMLADIETISESRNLREAGAIGGVTRLFWIVAVVGVVFVVVPFFVFPARKVNLLLLLSFAVYNGVVIYTIFALSHPFSPPGAVKPAPFVEVFRHDMGELLARTNDDAPVTGGE
jgi:hypothetical protein